MVGANLGGIADWMRTHEFADMMKQSRAFGPANTPWDGTVQLDESGFPRGDAGSMMLCCQPPNIGLGGIYEFSFECNSSEAPWMRSFDSSGTRLDYFRDSQTNRVVCRWEFPDAGEKMLFSFFKTNGGIRDMRMMRPGTAPGQLFMPQFTESIRHFGAIRFMPWTRTNNSEATQWSLRSTPEDVSFRWRTGVPYEHCVDLCNLLQRDMWINVPHMVNDDYVAKLARLIHDRLDPSLNVYVEYSNEVWNYMFFQADWNHDQAVQEAAEGNTVLTYDGVTDSDVLRHRRVAKRTVEIGERFAEVFGPGSLNTRVRPVLAGQFVAPWNQERMLRFINDVYGPPSEHVWSLAVAPYFGVQPDDQRALTSDEVLNALQRNLDTLPSSFAYESYATMSAWYGLRPFMAYEGGPDTTGANNLQTKREAMYDQRTNAMCHQYIRQWHEAGGGLFMWFHAGAASWINENGSWSLTEAIAWDSPKAAALREVVTQPVPESTAGTIFPGMIDLRKHLDRHADWQNNTRELMGWNDKRDYLVRVDRDGDYSLRIRAAAHVPTTRVWVGANNVYAGDIVISQLGVPNEPPRWFDGVTVRLHKGLNTIRLRTFENGYVFSLYELAQGCDSVDIDRDGVFPEDEDVLGFFGALAGATCEWGDCDVDFNNDGNFPSDEDIAAFFRVLAGGECVQ
jgi:hypothetical protein